MRAAVTGASGFVGGALVRALLERGDEVRCIDTHRGPALADLPVTFAQADVLEPQSLVSALAGAEVVYHLAAVISVTGDRTGLVRKVNVRGVANVAAASLGSGARRLVHCSSVHAFDLSAPGPVTELGRRATSQRLPPYDRSKAAGEAALREAVQRGLDAVIVNPTGLMGPLDFAPSRIGRLLLAMLRRRLPAVIEGGFDWVDVRDVCDGLLAAERQGRTGENYLLPGHHASLRDLNTLAGEVAGRPSRVPTLPMGFARLFAPVADLAGRWSASPFLYTSDALHALRHSPPVDGTKARDELGHEPRPLATTVRDAFEWFADSGVVAPGPKVSKHAR